MRIIDTHCHAGRNWFEPIETLLFQMDRNGVDGAVFIQHGGTYDNDYLFECATSNPGRFKVVVLVDPEDPDPTGSLARLSEQGAAGVRLAPTARVSGSDSLALWKTAGELGIAVSSIGSAAEFGSDDFKRVLDACPGTTVVIEHLAGVGITSPPYTDYERALECAERPNTFLKVPGLGEICPRPPRLDPDFHFENVPPLFEMAKEAFGVRRMMWGSDFPPSAGREGYANTLTGVMDHPAFSGDDDREWVMGRTAAAVWGFERSV